MSEQPELTCVRICHGMLIAELYRSKLELLDIPVLLQYESVGPVIGITADGLGEVWIMVPSELAAEADQALQEVSEDRPPEAEQDTL